MTTSASDPFALDQGQPIVPYCIFH